MDVLWIIVLGIVASVLPLFYFEEGKKIGRREERKRWEYIEVAEKWVAYYEKEGDAPAAARASSVAGFRCRGPAKPRSFPTSGCRCSPIPSRF